jgi:hypothetical protein
MSNGDTATVTDPAPNAFVGKKEQPTGADLETALGPAKPVWDRLLSDLADQHDVSVQEWKCYSPKSGWALRLKRGKRTIVWLAPSAGCFRVTFILGDKAVQAARQSGLSAATLRALEDAPKYPEGTGLRLIVKSPRDVPTVNKLAQIKLAN